MNTPELNPDVEPGTLVWSGRRVGKFISKNALGHAKVWQIIGPRSPKETSFVVYQLATPVSLREVQSWYHRQADELEDLLGQTALPYSPQDKEAAARMELDLDFWPDYESFYRLKAEANLEANQR